MSLVFLLADLEYQLADSLSFNNSEPDSAQIIWPSGFTTTTADKM